MSGLVKNKKKKDRDLVDGAGRRGWLRAGWPPLVFNVVWNKMFQKHILFNPWLFGFGEILSDMNYIYPVIFQCFSPLNHVNAIRVSQIVNSLVIMPENTRMLYRQCETEKKRRIIKK